MLVNGACDLCGSNVPQVLSTKVSDGGVAPVAVDLLMCGACGLVFLDPASNIPRGSDYWESHSSAKSRTPTAVLVLKLLNRARGVLSRVQRFTEAPGRLLDVGTGTGAILKVFHDAGWSVAGVEPSEDYAGYAKSQCPDARVQCSQFETAALSGSVFDLITMSHVLEHASSATEFLRVARELAGPGGLLYVEVPDLLAIPPQMHLWEYAELAHRFYFTERTLTGLMAKTGWQVVSVERIGPGRHLSALAVPMQQATRTIPHVVSDYEHTRRFLRSHAARRPFAAALRRMVFATIGKATARKLRDAVYVTLKTGQW
jgi:2-polyprenyl-3-methyl-5-hydroxy-6-metoxy-1,4-benzoquinol methylase